MTLRILRAASIGGDGTEGFAISQTQPDTWDTRIAKLIPAEALGLYGVGSAIIPMADVLSLSILIAACLAVTIIVRYRSTKSNVIGKAQWGAIAIAVVSFLLWVITLNPPEFLSDYDHIPALLTLIWGTIVPLVYKGSAS